MVCSPRLLVLGIGNLLMGDEGVGVHAIGALERERLPTGVEILDGGTGGFHLLSCLTEYPSVIVIDATMDGDEPGTVGIAKPRFLSDYPRSLGTHDVGLRDLIESAALLGPLPMVHLITVSITDIRSVTTELTPSVQRALARVVQAVHRILSEEGFPPSVAEA
ncbi:MAG: hydrogenase maturation protease [Thermoguttaceae bacterium]